MRESSLTVFEAFAASAQENGDRPFLAVLPDVADAYGIAAGEITYQDAMRRIDDLAERYARAGYGHGHRVGLLLEGKAPAREGAEIVTPDGKTIGRLTSGGFAPSLGRPIAMAYVAADHAAMGTKVSVLLRGKPVAAEIAAMPFVPNRYHRGK